jgi:PTH1 family peptidyl-tRNA hydrolase
VAGEAVLVVKPQTYMNRSGAALGALVADPEFLPSRDLLVLVDDVAIPLGAFRLRPEGSAGGHNGLKSVEGALMSPAYARLRIGVGPKPDAIEDLSDFVLAPFEPEELAALDPLWPIMSDAVECWVADGIDDAMKRYNHLGKPRD